MKIEDAEAKAAKFVRNGAGQLKKRREGKFFSKQVRRSRQYITDIKVSGEMSLSRAIFMADWFGKSLDEFLEEAENEEGDRGKLEPPRRKPAIIKAVTKRFRELDGVTGDVAMCSALKEIDDLRYENPIIARQKLETVVKKLHPDQAPFALNVAASCFRMTLEFNKSSACFLVAREMAFGHENQIGLGDNSQRWVYLLCNVGMRNLALVKNRDSRERFVECCILEKVAETFVERAYCIYQLGQYAEALKSYLEAGRLDNFLTPRFQITWRQAAADCLGRLGEFDLARRYSEEALKRSGEVGILFQNQALWVCGRIEGMALNLAAAERLIHGAARNLKTNYPADSLIAILELAAICLRCDRADRCIKIIEELPDFSKDFEGVPQISKAVMDLYSLLRLNRTVSVRAIEDCIGLVKANRAKDYRARSRI